MTRKGVRVCIQNEVEFLVKKARQVSLGRSPNPVDERIAPKQGLGGFFSEPGNMGVRVLSAKRRKETGRPQDISIRSEFDDKDANADWVVRGALPANDPGLLVRRAGTVGAKVAAIRS
jgi:hypothetical protein